MDPIGASQDLGVARLRTFLDRIDGQRVQSVSGGAHWGGGMFISARDHARLGLLVARGGRWEGRQLLSQGLDCEMLAPSPTNRCLRLSVVAQSRRRALPQRAGSSVFALGAGANMIWIDPDHDLVAVLRWIDGTAVDGFLSRLLAAVV